MKKLLLILALSAASLFAANAQIGFNAGYTNDTWDVAIKNTGGGYGMYIRTQGFFIGVNYALPVIGELSFVPGINFSSAKGDFISSDTDLKTQFIDIPLNFEFRHKISNLFAVVGFAGPGARYALSAEAKSKGDSIDLFSDDYKVLGNKFDITLNGGIGIEVAGIRFSASYDTGLLNFASDELKKTIARRINSTGFRLGVSYVLNF